MYRDGVGHIQLRQHIGGVGGGAVVKADDDQLPGGVDVLYHAHVTVENAAAAGAVVLLPDHVVVVAGLHDPVAHPERYIAPLLLPPSGSRGFSAACKARFSAAVPQAPFRVGESTCICSVGMPMFLGRRSRHSSTTVCTSLSGERRHRKKKSPARCPDGAAPLIDGVGVADDGGLLRLTEHLRQRYRRDHAAAQHITQHVARPHRRQLIRVAHQHQPTARPQRLQQGAHQLDVHHAHLVHDDGVSLQRVVGIFAEHGLSGHLVVAHAQRPVDGLGVRARHLAQTLGRPSGGRQQRHVQPHPLIQRHDAPQEVVLPVPGPPVSSRMPPCAASSTACRCMGA